MPGIALGERSLTVAVKNIARRLGDDISESKPILDSRLPDGSRVAAVIPPCSLCGVTLTIRKFNSRHFDIEDLIRSGTLDRGLANQLEDYLLQRRNLLISGGTGTGKTTLLTALGKFIPADERILLIEDTAEIQLAHENLVCFEARREHNGTPAVSIRDLLKAALRHRPDRILVGEVRGGGSVRFIAASEYGPLRNHLDNSRQLRKTGVITIHKLCSAKRRGSPVPRH